MVAVLSTIGTIKSLRRNFIGDGREAALRAITVARFPPLNDVKIAC